MSEDIGKIEYRIKKVERFIITRYCETDSEDGSAGVVETKGEYDNPDLAYEVGYALAKHDHEALGWPPGDERIQYPEHPTGSPALPGAVQ